MFLYHHRKSLQCTSCFQAQDIVAGGPPILAAARRRLVVLGLGGPLVAMFEAQLPNPTAPASPAEAWFRPVLALAALAIGFHQFMRVRCAPHHGLAQLKVCRISCRLPQKAQCSAEALGRQAQCPHFGSVIVHTRADMETRGIRDPWQQTGWRRAPVFAMAGSALQCGEAGPSARCWPAPTRTLSTRTMREQTWTGYWSGLRTHALWGVRCWPGGRKRGPKRSALHASLMVVCMLGTKAGVRSRSALRNDLTGTGTWGLVPELKAGCRQAEVEQAYEVRHPAGGAREGTLRSSESARAWNAWRLQLGSYSMRPKLGQGQMCSQAREIKRASPGRLLMMQSITAHRFPLRPHMHGLGYTLEVKIM